LLEKVKFPMDEKDNEKTPTQSGRQAIFGIQEILDVSGV
jgi:hypothetical protein